MAAKKNAPQSITELDHFHDLDGRLGELLERQTTIADEQRTAQAELEAAREARAAAAAEPGGNPLLDAKRRERDALERLATLEEDAADVAAGIEALRRQVVAAEKAAKVALMRHWRGEAERLTAELAERLEELRPLVCEAYWATTGAVPGVHTTTHSFLLRVVSPALGLDSADLVFENRPELPTVPPETHHVNDTHRSLIRGELARQSTDGNPPPAAA